MRWERTAAADAAAPPDRVWEVLLDGRRWSEWNDGVEWMTVEGPLAAGSLLTMKPKRAPQTAFRIEAVLPPRILALVLTFGPVASLRLRWELAPQGDGNTTLSATVAISGPLAGLLLGRAASRVAEALPATLGRLAGRAERESAAVAGRALKE